MLTLSTVNDTILGKSSNKKGVTNITNSKNKLMLTVWAFDLEGS